RRAAQLRADLTLRHAALPGRERVHPPQHGMGAGEPCAVPRRRYAGRDGSDPEGRRGAIGESREPVALADPGLHLAEALRRVGGQSEEELADRRLDRTALALQAAVYQRLEAVEGTPPPAQTRLHLPAALDGVESATGLLEQRLQPMCGSRAAQGGRRGGLYRVGQHLE